MSRDKRGRKITQTENCQQTVINQWRARRSRVDDRDYNVPLATNRRRRKKKKEEKEKLEMLKIQKRNTQ